MKLRHLRYLLVLLILIICVNATVKLFDWHIVARAIRHMDPGILLGGGLSILLAIFALRGWRWLIVLGIQPDRRRFWHSFCANGAAAGLASLTPFQLGEIVKIRMIPDHHGSAWRLGVSGFFVERVLDLGGMFGIGLCGLAMHFAWNWLAPLALLLPLLGGLFLSLLSIHVRRLPKRLQPYTEALHHVRRIVFASLLTILIWLLYTGLWWIAALSMHVHLGFGQATLLLGGVMLAIVASMTPGGLGVSELGSRGIMLWLGASVTDADTTAIAVRLLTPLIVLVGLACLLPLLLRHRRR
ncbi:lysylphosphatidylglycerol synthase transmembrane domain-containing protein [Rhodanobacter sp. Si-c]|uniref:Lysylphosphatidylglycerol synthase transmembrane domain-containing protein n=1 Tax=Rhodanobacter lycopersici TaxID=3162487 RepID=A0ABV3QC18_9GAMM